MARPTFAAVPSSYTARYFADVLRMVADALAKTRDKGADLELAGGERLILTDSATGARCAVTLTNGVFSATELP